MDPGLPGRGDRVEKPPPPVLGDLRRELHGTEPHQIGIDIAPLPLGLGGSGGGAKAEGGTAGALEAEGEPGEEDKDGEEDGEGLRPLQEDGHGGEGGGAGWRRRWRRRRRRRRVGEREGGVLLVELEAGPSRVCHVGERRGISHSATLQPTAVAAGVGGSFLRFFVLLVAFLDSK